MTFVKLNQKFSNIQYAEGGDMEVSYAGIIGYFNVKDLKADVFKVIPKDYRNAFSVSEMKIIDAVPPHTDSDVKTVVNFYVRPSNYRTVFFKGDSPAYQIPNQTNGQMFYRENLVEVESFIAKEGDAFCLDVTVPHAVDVLDEVPKERIAICMSTDEYDFEQVCNMLCDTGYAH
jgi:hypothetical protein